MQAKPQKWREASRGSEYTEERSSISRRRRRISFIQSNAQQNMESPEENGNVLFMCNNNSCASQSILSQSQHQAAAENINESRTRTPMKLVPIQRLYSNFSEDSKGSNGNDSCKVGSKGKARKLLEGKKGKEISSSDGRKSKPLLVYSRTRKNGAQNKNTHMENGIAIPRPLSYAQRLLERLKLLQNQTHEEKSNTGGVGGKDSDALASGDVVMEDKNSKGSAGPTDDDDNQEVHCEGIEDGILQGSGDDQGKRHGHLEKMANGLIVPVVGGGNSGGQMKKKKFQKKRTFEGIDLFTEKRRRLNNGTWLRDSRVRKQRAANLAVNWNSQAARRKERLPASAVKSETSGNDHKKKWTEVSLSEADPMALLGYKCKVYWPLDDEWYSGVIDQYDAEKSKHHVKYVDGEDEWLFLTEEKLKLYCTGEEMNNLNLKDREQILINEMIKDVKYEEMAALAATLEDYQGEPGHGDLIWAKITGHPMWPAFVMDEAHANACDGLEQATREGSIPLQFFGSYDYARISSKHVMPFSKGFLFSFHLKCKRLTFLRGLRETWGYLREQKLPKEMAKLQTQVGCAMENGKESEQSDGDEDCMGDERSEKIKKSVECLFSCPIVIGSLRVISLGKIVKDSEHFHDEHHIWTEGYTVIRKFSSIKGPDRYAEYKMEVLRNPLARSFPLFRITLEDGEQIDGSTPTECWKKIFARLEKAKQKLGNGLKVHLEKRRQYRSGSYMFGFANHRITHLIQALPHARACSKYTDWIDKFAGENCDEVVPAGYRPVNVQWKDLDRCSVCHMEEEYVNNVFLQCDKCRMMVHANCYGELEPVDGKLWHCKLCRPGAPKRWPPCCLCPITGGAMKQTTCGRWAHLTCATWIPETCLVDIKRMEPIDGVNRINKDRWKLICSICEVPYGACIQCSEHNCRVAYHPLCARAAGLCVEVLEDKRCRQTGSVHEESEQNLRLLSFCKKHRQPTDEGTPIDQQESLPVRDCSMYIPPSNPSGCARCEPYNFSERRGRKEPEAASSKRLFVENRPYLVSGCRRNGPSADVQVNATPGLRNSCENSRLLESSRQYSSRQQVDGSRSLMSDKYEHVSEKYEHMRATVRKRLAFGKSVIHGFGIFAKQAHKAGDMIIEYAGEIVRPLIADIRERFIYNSLVGAGTYMFRIDDKRVIDATRAGSIAHLINHSCEPNCHSRVINVHGEDHIIIFAKRDIKQWEELTYDYRFLSIDEQLACYCGFPRCRGIVNVNDTEEQIAHFCVPRRELTCWTPDDDK